jgi:hypothetical protein
VAADPSAVLPTASGGQILRRIFDRIPLAVRRAFIPFVVTRLLIALLLATVPLMQQGLADHWGARDNMRIRVSPAAMATGFERVAIGNDSSFYYGIASEGYEERPFDTTTATRWAFFPLHPLLWRAAAHVTGEWLWSGILVANVIAFAAFCLMWSLAYTLTSDISLADSALVFALCWPTTYFMMLPHSEALFFLLVTAAFLADQVRRPWLSPLIGGFASAARVNGVFLAPALLVDRWYRGERTLRDILPLGLTAVGLAAFMAYLWHATGNPLAFKDIQVIWGRSFHMPWTALTDYVSRPLQLVAPWNPKVLNFAVTVLAGISIATCWKRGWRGLAVFTGLTLLAPLCTGTLMSMGRYLSVSPGIFLALATWSADRPRFALLWQATSVLALTLLCTLFALHIDIGGA